MSKKEYLIELKPKYRKAGRKLKGQLLSDFCDMTGYHRKYASSILNKPIAVSKEKKQKMPRQKKYDQPVIDAILTIWRASNKICGERLQPYIPEMLEKLIQVKEISVTEEIKEKLLEISMATVKRIVGKEKNRSHLKIGGTTKPGSLLKSQIEVRYGRWEETAPGWCEVDTVAHCGGNVSGEFVYSLDVIDISTGWSEQAAVWGKGEMATKEQIDNVRKRLPFKLLGLDPDNGSEFINWQLFRYCKKNNINLTRSRPYHKNDNAHVEQKNYPAIRQLIGYDRLDQKEQLNIMNDLYQNEWRLYLNFFQPTRKIKERIKDTETGKSKKKYYESKTPFGRLTDHPTTTTQQKEMLQSIYKELSPFDLLRKIEEKIKVLEKTLK